jgi:toxin YoeB
MNYQLDFFDRAKKELIEYERIGDKKKLSKVRNLFKELKEHPTTGTGKPKPLRENRSGEWSRRIDQEHRIVYTIDHKKKIVEIKSIESHYE